MGVVLGVVAMAVGVAVFVLAPRMVRANEASSAELFGRYDPYKKAPRFTRAWSMTVTRLVAVLFVVFGLLAIVGVLDWG